jgi:tetratricopeptide (TPR) repeat protein
MSGLLPAFSFRIVSAAGLAPASAELLAGSALAGDRAECAKAAGKGAISACSRLISGGKLGKFAASAFLNRGTPYAQTPDLDAALNELNEALRLDPKFAAAYAVRGTAPREKPIFQLLFGSGLAMSKTRQVVVA